MAAKVHQRLLPGQVLRSSRTAVVQSMWLQLGVLTAMLTKHGGRGRPTGGRRDCHVVSRHVQHNSVARGSLSLQLLLVCEVGCPPLTTAANQR